MKENELPSYTKIDVLLKSGDISTTKLEFKNCGMVITNDHIIITVKSIDTEHTLTTVGTIFRISEISAFKTYNNII